MIALIQRVTAASVSINSKIHSKIDEGILVFLGIANLDTEADSNYVIKKLLNLRIFPNDDSNFDLSVEKSDRSILIISNFTLSANTRTGNRPDFSNALNPKKAKILYEKFTISLKEKFPKVKTGIFGEEMEVNLNNWGPVALIINSNDKNYSRSSF